MSLKSRWVTLWLWGRQGFYGKTNHFTRLLGALGRSEQALRNRNSSRHNLKPLSAFLITTFLTLQGRFLAGLLPHLWQPWAAGTVALLWQWTTWRLQQEGRTQGAGDGQCWNDKCVPWLRNPQESQALTGKSCGSPLLLPSGLFLGLLGDRCTQQSSTVGSFPLASHSQPFKAEAGEHHLPPGSQGNPPNTVLALRGCPLLSPP